MNNTNLKIVYSKKAAIELRKLGYKIVKVEPNIKYPQFDVYFFEATKELIAALNKITAKA